MMLKTYYITLILLLPSLFFAQSNFNIDYDYSCMCLNDTTGYIELYYNFRPFEMKKTVIEKDTCITGVLFVKIGNVANDDVLIDRVWKFDHVIGEQKNEQDKNGLVGQFRFALPEGRYYCDLLAKDGNDTVRQCNGRFEFDIKSFNQDRFTLSDLQLASSISKTSVAKDSPFYKNQYEVIPNPSLMFGDQLPVVFIYCELYGLNIGAKSETFELQYELVNNNDHVFIDKTKYVPSSLPSMVFVNAVNVKDYPTGPYNLVLTVADTGRGIKDRGTKNLYIYNPQVADTSGVGVNASVVASEYFALNEEEINEIFDYSRYLASDAEIKVWDRLSNPNDKKVFLYHFWKARDLTPDDSRNEYKSEYLRRVNIANERFKTMNRKGWQTDKGRVYCLYGEPSDIDRHPALIEGRPYEIWRYDQIEGGVIFIFADLYGTSDMTLIHSTKLGEIRDDDWHRKIDAFR